METHSIPFPSRYIGLEKDDLFTHIILIIIFTLDVQDIWFIEHTTDFSWTFHFDGRAWLWSRIIYLRHPHFSIDVRHPAFSVGIDTRFSSLGQVRLGMGACAGATRHCVHFPPVFQGPPSGHPPGRSRAHPHLLEMLINLLQPWGTWSAHWPPPLTRLPRSDNLMSRISIRKWVTCPYSRSCCSRTMQVTNLIWVSLSNRSLDTKSDQR